METLKEAQVRKGIMYVFKNFLKNYVNYTEPVRILTSKWHTNKYSRGAYSSRSLATDKTKASAKKLSTPLRNALCLPLVLFAGEATHENYYGVVHGAVESGYREAQRLTNLR